MLTRDIENDLLQHLQQNLPEHSFKEVLEYAVFPAGKLFRPHLVHSLANDLGEIQNDHRVLASFVEIHHAYTLVHDDLPCMDNDDIRRGKPSTHKKFGQWQAVLAGDALMSASYGLLAKIRTSKLNLLRKFNCWATGAKGLILGQVMDMGLESQQSLKRLLTMHQLKTSRLIQICLVGAYYISKGHTLQSYKDMMKLGLAMGISFQLLDDLKEVALDEVNQHEKEVSPYFLYGEQKMLELIYQQNEIINEICSRYKLENVRRMYSDYWDKSKTVISKKISI